MKRLPPEFFLSTSQVFGGVYYTVVFGGLMTLFFLQEGAQEFLIGIFAIIPSLVAILLLYIIPLVRRWYPEILLWSSITMAATGFSLLLLFPASLSLSLSTLVGCYILFLILYHISVSSFNYSWFPAVALLIPAERRGEFFGRIRMGLVLLSFFALKLSSKILGENPGYMQFFWIVLIVALVQTIRPVSLASIAFPEVLPVSRFSHCRFLRSMFKNIDFRKFFLYYFLLSCLNSFILPFLVPFLRVNLGMSASFCLFLPSVSLFSYGISVYGWGKLNDVKGSRFVLFASLLFSTLFWFVLCNLRLFPSHYLREILIGLYFLSGLGSGGQELALTTRRMVLAPGEELVPYLAYFLILGGNVPAILFPLLGGAVLQRFSSFAIGGIGIYQLLFFLVGVADIFLLFYITKMPRLKEASLKRVFRDLVNDGLMKFHEVLVSP
ncbi:MAG: MFS transporter [Candidatus Ratteibacteria bacterium]|jgi:hypothetical protein